MKRLIVLLLAGLFILSFAVAAYSETRSQEEITAAVADQVKSALQAYLIQNWGGKDVEVLSVDIVPDGSHMYKGTVSLKESGQLSTFPIRECFVDDEGNLLEFNFVSGAVRVPGTNTPGGTGMQIIVKKPQIRNRSEMQKVIAKIADQVKSALQAYVDNNAASISSSKIEITRVQIRYEPFRVNIYAGRADFTLDGRPGNGWQLTDIHVDDEGNLLKFYTRGYPLDGKGQVLQ